MRCDLKMKVLHEKFKLHLESVIKVRIRAIDTEGKYGKWSHENIQ